MFYNDPKFKSKHTKVNNPGKLIPFSGHPSDFIGINLKPLVLVQPFGESKPCKIQGINPGQAIGFAGNNQNTIQSDVGLDISEYVICFDVFLRHHKI